MRKSSTASVIRLLALWLVCLSMGALPASAFEIEFEHVYGNADAKTTINILSSTDSERFKLETLAVGR